MANIIKTNMVFEGEVIVLLRSDSVGLVSFYIFWVRFFQVGE